jgi:CheY-like chemotaxis protein
MINFRVLIVDDDPDIRAGVGAALKDDPFFVSRACAGGRAALAAAVEWRPDLILLDEEMPGMNGTTVLKRLRADRRTAPIPVVFMAAASVPSRRAARLLACGAAGVIDKPCIDKPCIDKGCDPTTLGATLRRFVAVEGVLSPARERFFRRLEADAGALSDCRRDLAQTRPEPVLMRINQIAHSLAGAGGIYGFAGISCDSAALSDAAAGILAGRARPSEVERALDRLLERIEPR